METHDVAESPPEAALAAVAPAAPRTASAPRSERSTAREMEREDDLSVREWLDSLGAGAAIKVVISRRKPSLGPNGEKIDGTLETVEDRIDEEYVREHWGGGLFLLQVHTPKPNGQWKILRARTVNIAGQPKMNGQLLLRGQPLDAAASTQTISGDDTLAERAFVSMSEMAKEERARADRLQSMAQRPTPGLDVAALQALNAPLVAQLAAAHDTIARLQSDLMASINKPAPRDEFRDQIMTQAFGDQSNRIQGLREQYEGRMDRMRDEHNATIKRLEERHEKALERLEERHADEIRRIEEAHSRELRSMEKVGEMSSKSLDTANTTRVESLKAENDRIARELAAAQTRIATLEAKKDQTLAEKADEIIKVKEAIEGIAGDSGGDGDGKWYEKVLDLVGNSEAALKLVDKLGNGPGQQQQQVPPPGMAVQGPDGNWYVNRGDGQMVMVDARMVKQQQALAANQHQPGNNPRKRKGKAAAVTPQAQADEDAIEQVQEPVKAPSAKDMKMAITFMENALKAGTDPVKFAQSARNMVPGDVLTFVQRVGIDAIISKAVDPSSNLATIRGRQFARAVAAALVGDVPPTVAVAVQPDDGDDGDDEDDDEIGDALDNALDGNEDDDEGGGEG